MDLAALAARKADKPLPIPSKLPTQAPKADQPRFAESSIYPYLKTNIESVPMEFTQEPIPVERTERSIAVHGPDTPFRYWEVVRRYIRGPVERRGYEDLVEYNTTVELAEKVGSEWKLTLRREGKESDYWWVEWFDALWRRAGITACRISLRSRAWTPLRKRALVACCTASSFGERTSSKAR